MGAHELLQDEAGYLRAFKNFRNDFAAVLTLGHCSPKDYRDENGHTECTTTCTDLPALTEEELAL